MKICVSATKFSEITATKLIPPVIFSKMDEQGYKITYEQARFLSFGLGCAFNIAPHRKELPEQVRIPIGRFHKDGR